MCQSLQASLQSAKSQDDYVDRLPSPPQIWVPPPQSHGKVKNPEFSSHAPDVFHGVELPTDYITQEWGRWSYQRRREAQQILPFLWLGPMTIAKDESFLKQAGITMLLIVRQQGSGGPKPAALRVAEELGLESHVAHVSDTQSLVAALPAAMRSINNHVAAQKRVNGSFGNVLCCCESGNERSAAVVIAYTMEVTNLDLVESIQLAQNQRFCINLDDSIKNGLQSYEHILQAQWDVMAGSGQPKLVHRRSIMCDLPPPDPDAERRKLKRPLDTSVPEDADTEMTDSDGVVDPARRNFTPFTDQ